ncbi:hypothetical protein ONZ43_g4521 [Nemania bipapillata]|uniref:Uncharacterized protein n=1 Tax=Nemania bipapillata TaxID=110536 RepID=A0ACC2ILS8_9PEZI|nr:hypothetical protein ONZ43_g4521 [Nemania bipapillata]
MNECRWAPLQWPKALKPLPQPPFQRDSYYGLDCLVRGIQQTARASIRRLAKSVHERASAEREKFQKSFKAFANANRIPRGPPLSDLVVTTSTTPTGYQNYTACLRSLHVELRPQADHCGRSVKANLALTRTKRLEEKGDKLISEQVERRFLFKAPSVSLATVLEKRKLHGHDLLRLLLSYLLAKAVWQLYDSDWTASNWSKDSRHFMRERVNDQPKHHEVIALFTYVVAPLGRLIKQAWSRDRDPETFDANPVFFEADEIPSDDGNPFNLDPPAAEHLSRAQTPTLEQTPTSSLPNIESQSRLYPSPSQPDTELETLSLDGGELLDAINGDNTIEDRDEDRDRIKEKVTFIGGDADVDAVGHGTHIAAIILRLTKNVDLYIGKITNTSSVSQRETVVERVVSRRVGNLTTSHYPPTPSAMADQDRSEIIRSNPIGNGLDAFRESTSIPCSEEAFNQLNEENFQNTTIDLLLALQQLRASRVFRFSNKTLSSGLLSLASAVASNDFDYARVKPLLVAVIAKKCDEEVWDQVYNAVTESTPPPRPIASSLQQTPWLRNTVSFVNSSEHRKYVNDVLTEELGPMYAGLRNLNETYFGGVAPKVETHYLVKGDGPGGHRMRIKMAS